MLRWTHPARRSSSLVPCAALALVALLTLVAASCRPKRPAAAPLLGQGAARVDPKTLPVRIPVVDPKYPPNPPSFPLVAVPDKSVGPFLARRHDAALAAYIAPGEGAGRRLISVPVGADGSPLEPQLVAPVSADATTMVVRDAGGEGGAYVVAWTDLTDRGEAISVTGVTALGKPMSTPIELARTQDDIVWIELLPTSRGEVCVWVEEARSGGANLFGVPLDPDGKPRGLPSAIVRGISGWQAVATGNGAGLSLVTHRAGTSEPSRGVTTISWLRLDEEARAVGAPVVLETTPLRVIDVDVARVAEGFVLAWTRRGGAEPEVVVAGVDAAGKVTPPLSVSARSGGASLVDAVGGPHGGVLAWEETTRLARGTRRLHLVPLPEGKLPDPTTGPAVAGVLDVDTAGIAEVLPLASGFAVLARLRTCASPPVDGVPCDDPPPSFAFVRLDERLAVTETQPILLDQTQTRAPLAWGLSCDAADCFVLAAGPETPASEVRIVRLTPSPNRWRAPIAPLPSPDAPRVVAVDTLASSDLYSELAVAEMKGGPLLAAITTESAQKGDATLAATVMTTPLGPDGAARGVPVVLSRRGRPEGGVAVAAAEGLAGGAVAWVARENGHAAVHVTRVDANGKRTNDVQLTTAAGDASDVALRWAGGGWVVAWVDTRDGNGEVYATKVDPDLRRVAREVRLTHAEGDASDVALLTQATADGPVVWVAWADPRESPKDGVADIYTMRLRGADATPLGFEARLLATVPHSRSPALALGDGPRLSIAWIEEAPAGADPSAASVYGAMIGVLDSLGHLVGEPIRTRGADDGFPTSIAIEWARGGLHAVLTRGTRDDVFLDALSLSEGRPPRAFALFGLEGPPSMDVALSLDGSAVYFNDQSEGAAEGRIRRVTLEWSR